MARRFAILTISDRCSRGQSPDTSGPLLKELIESNNFQVVEYDIVSDDKNSIKEILIKWSNRKEINCVITTGGTGLTYRDVTPEATSEVIEKEVPGVCHALISASLRATPMAMLSRLKCGVFNRTLIINFPGSRKACNECFEVILPILNHAIDQLNDDTNQIQILHQEIQHGQLPKSNVQEDPVSQRYRHSPFEMISILDAFKIIFAEVGHHFDRKDLIEIIPANSLFKALDFILAKDVYALEPLPPFDASIKDGYAVISNDGSGFRKVLTKASIAGSNPVPIIKTGFCARISTGASVPPGADAVVQVEDTELVKMTENKEEEIINIKKIPIIGQDIRPIGSDIPVDAANPLIPKNVQLTSIDLGLIASIGVLDISVYRRPVVAVLSTGDEIVSAGDPRPPNCVRDSNRTVLMSLLVSQHFRVIDLGISPDTADEIFSHIRKGLKSADVLVTTGGVSMGERDLVKQVLEKDFSAKIHFGRVNIKPGKPTTFSTTIFENKKKYIFALPGNPVSAFVTYKIFVEPSLFLLSGKYHDHVGQELTEFKFHKWIKCKVSLDKPYEIDSRPEFVRAKISFSDNEDLIPEARLTERNQISSRLLNVKNANGLLFLDTKNGAKFLNDGDIILSILL